MFIIIIINTINLYPSIQPMQQIVSKYIIITIKWMVFKKKFFSLCIEWIGRPLTYHTHTNINQQISLNFSNNQSTSFQTIFSSSGLFYHHHHHHNQVKFLQMKKKSMSHNYYKGWEWEKQSARERELAMFFRLLFSILFFFSTNQPTTHTHTHWWW